MLARWRALCGRNSMRCNRYIGTVALSVTIRCRVAAPGGGKRSERALAWRDRWSELTQFVSATHA